MSQNLNNGHWMFVFDSSAVASVFFLPNIHGEKIFDNVDLSPGKQGLAFLFTHWKL